MRRLLSSYLGSSKRQKDPAVEEAESCFTTEQIGSVKSCIKQAAGGCENLDHAAFAAHLGLGKSALAKGICKAIDKSNTGLITYEDFIVALKVAWKGVEHEQALIAFRALDSRGQGCLMKNDISGGVDEAWKMVGPKETRAGELNVGEVVAEGALRMQGAKSALDFEDFKKWSVKVPALAMAIVSLIKVSDVVRSPPHHMPDLIATAEAHEKGLILNQRWLWLLSGGMPVNYCQDWKLLFSSRVHGMSFNTFTGKISAKGVTLLLVRDEAGCVFGGLATVPWAKSGDFFGDYSSFIFRMHPTYEVYPTSGSNENFQWCGSGFTQIPNGVGFGGRMGYFSLFIDSTFEKGMSRPTATYASPCLASSEVFKVEGVECWLVEPAEEDPFALKNSGSILTRNLEDQRIMELSGKVTHSMGLMDDDER